MLTKHERELFARLVPELEAQRKYLERVVAPLIQEHRATLKAFEADLRRIRPGTLYGDLCIVQSVGLYGREADDAARLAAADRIARRMARHWNTKRSWAVYRAISARAAAAGKEWLTIKRETLAAAVWNVLIERNQEQKHRFGSHGSSVTSIPTKWSVSRFMEWFEDDVIKAAEADLLGEDYPRSRSVPVEPFVPEHASCDADQDLLTALLDSEQVRGLLAAATPRQRELLALLLDGMEAEEAAVALNVTETTVRVMLSHIRKRVTGEPRTA